MGMDTNGPSAMGLYANAGKEDTPPDTGLSTGRALYDAGLSARARYAEPLQARGDENAKLASEVGVGNTQPPYYYNYEPAQPVKYQVPSALKERMAAREAVRIAAGDSKGGSATKRWDPISEDEVTYLQAMQDQAELADFDRYVNSLIDPRKPGNLKWLMEIYPDFVNRRIQQVHTDYEYALRGQMIDSWGINTFDDLHFKYLQDQGKIKGPKLTEHATPGAGYSTGILSPFYNNKERAEGVRLPFASANYGKRASDAKSWLMPDAAPKASGLGAPLGSGRTLEEMASRMYISNE